MVKKAPKQDTALKLITSIFDKYISEDLKVEFNK